MMIHQVLDPQLFAATFEQVSKMETPDLRGSQFWKVLTCHPSGVFDQVLDHIVQGCVGEKMKMKVDCLELQKGFLFWVPLVTPYTQTQGESKQ